MRAMAAASEVVARRDFISFAAGQLRHDVRRRIDLSQGFENRGGVDGHRAAHAIVELVVPRERLQVAVEDDADEFARTIDDRTSGVAADDVYRADEIERRGSLDRRLLR